MVGLAGRTGPGPRLGAASETPSVAGTGGSAPGVQGAVTWAQVRTLQPRGRQLPAPSWAPPVTVGLQGPVLSAPRPGSWEAGATCPCRPAPALPSCAAIGSPSLPRAHTLLRVAVIDFCLTRTLVCDEDTNYQSLRLSWASKTSCNQRKGKLGRTPPALRSALPARSLSPPSRHGASSGSAEPWTL